MKTEIKVNNVSNFAKERREEYPYIVAKAIEGEWWYQGCFSTRDKADACVMELANEYGIVAVVVSNEES